jgi:hypothetical protein
MSSGGNQPSFSIRSKNFLVFRITVPIPWLAETLHEDRYWMAKPYAGNGGVSLVPSVRSL